MILKVKNVFSEGWELRSDGCGGQTGQGEVGELDKANYIGTILKLNCEDQLISLLFI